MFKSLINGRRRLQTLRAFLALVQDPNKTERVFVLADLLRTAKSPLLDITMSYVASLEGVTELYREGYNPPLPPLKELAQYPEGSFGRTFADHMTKNNLKVDFYPHVKGTEFVIFALERGRKLHDLWHVLLGFDTSIAGEIGIQAFGVAQMRAPFPAVLVAAGILHSVTHAPLIFNEVLDKIFYGFQLGRQIKPLLGVKLEEELMTDLGQLRASLGLQSQGLRSDQFKGSSMHASLNAL